MYFAYDGDKIGRKLESVLIENNEMLIIKYTKNVSFALKALEEALTEKGCKIFFASGDSILAKSTEPFNPDEIQRKYGDITFSLGMGSTPLEAMLALKIAKANAYSLTVLFKKSYCQNFKAKISLNIKSIF